MSATHPDTRPRDGARGASDAPPWRAGVATIDITPETGIWMAGYAARTEPSRSVAMPLRAKALALEDGNGDAAVILSADLLGLTARMTERIARAVRERHGLPRARLLLNVTHTHCGPATDDLLSVAYDLTPARREAIGNYTADVEAKLIAVIGDALTHLRPARLSFGRGEAGFAANRRVQVDGPVDRTVPVLRVEANESPLAIVFGYACHTTTLPPEFTSIHGDYAGVAEARLEADHPGAVALFVSGCGGDANPKPRGTLALAEAHGVALAGAVGRVLSEVAMTPVDGPLCAAFDVVDVPFAPVPGRDVWTEKLGDENPYVRRHARLMLDTIARDGRLPEAQPVAIQVWRVGGAFTLIAIGGEVVADYAVRLTRDHPDERLWIAGYSDDLFGYLPSRRVLDEGGYEGGAATIFFGRPGPFTPAVEEIVHRAVRRLMSAAEMSPFMAGARGAAAGPGNRS